jgi:light-regulated signal transduction histidine kinase (bacteriophytochrome)
VNAELKDFAYVVSHDLKAPLRAVSKLAEWIATDYADAIDEEGKKLIDLLLGRVKRMHNLIEGILQYSRIGRMGLKATRVDLNTLVQEVIDLVAPPENINKILIEGRLPVVRGKLTRLKQIFQNLMDNAVKYMDKPGGEIRISCVDEGNHWKFSVMDNGPGIDEKYFNKIFKIFQTLAPRDQLESTGIGLTLVKKIVETSGGKIWVKSEIGKGSTFFFTLPKNRFESGGENERLQTNSAGGRRPGGCNDRPTYI